MSREDTQRRERESLSPYAFLSAQSTGRAVSEPECAVRTCFQRDIDRIVHSKAFRRLMHKTQVFLNPEGDHYRTRMTHTLEVSRIARTIARGLALNEDLTEAAALGHDLGHTPFGHAGEKALDQILPGGFRHNEQSLRVVERLEHGGRGLNLTFEVREGIVCHTGERIPAALEGQIIRFADQIAYINHDIDDAVRAGIIQNADIPGEIAAVLGTRHSERINTLVRDILENSGEGLRQSTQAARAMQDLRAFMFERVYRNSVAKAEESKAQAMLLSLFEFYFDHPDALPADYRALIEREGRERVVCDYIAGMTDNYAVEKYQAYFIPFGWAKK